MQERPRKLFMQTLFFGVGVFWGGLFSLDSQRASDSRESPQTCDLIRNFYPTKHDSQARGSVREP